METVDDAVEQREEETVKLVMQEIMKDVEGFADKIVWLGVAKWSLREELMFWNTCNLA